MTKFFSYFILLSSSLIMFASIGFYLYYQNHPNPYLSQPKNLSSIDLINRDFQKGILSEGGKMVLYTLALKSPKLLPTIYLSQTNFNPAPIDDEITDFINNADKVCKLDQNDYRLIKEYFPDIAKCLK